VALGVGLLIGGERERRKRQKPAPSWAGIRTFAVASMVGALSLMLGGALLLAVALGAVAAAAILEARPIAGEDPGITTEVALLLTVLIGALAVSQPAAAAAAGVTVAILLAARTPLHNFVGKVLTPDEGRDALIFAAATLVVLPLLPDRAMGPFHALNPHAIWIVLILILAITAAGHIAVRLLGARFGLPIAGLASGFVSSVATIGAMGARTRVTPGTLGPAVAGAVLSTVATILQMAGVIGVTSPSTLRALAVPLVCAGLIALGYGATFTLRALRPPAEDQPVTGHAFSLVSAITFAGTLSIILVASAGLRHVFGDAGSVAVAALAGLVDAHAAAISIAALVASGLMSPQDAVLPILVGLSTNTVTKLVFAATTGGRAFALRVIPGLILVAAAGWGGAAAMRAFAP
jgi:uncharacterized membrane protein (DUF4010 family)